MTSFCCGCIQKWLRGEPKVDALRDPNRMDIIVIKPGERGGDETENIDSRGEYFDGELEDMVTPYTSNTPLLLTPAAPIISRTSSKQRFVSYQQQEETPNNSSRGQQGGTSLECVVCLEEFDADNPRMPTLCSCGDNRALFHYPCLLTYLEDKRHCPICRTELYYQVCDDFSECSSMHKSKPFSFSFLFFMTEQEMGSQHSR